MSLYTLTHELKLVSHQCGQCGITFAMPEDFKERRLQDRQTFYCPNGHPRVFAGETAASQLKRALAREQQVRDQLHASERQKRAYKGAATRARNKVARVENGVCPHCNRSFQDLRRHMESKHS